MAYLIDAHSYIFRAYHAIPPMHGPSGEAVHATYGFARTVLKLLREREPQYVVAVFERGGSFRTQLYDAYKANRVRPPDDLVPQFESSRRAIAALGIACREVEGFEADDVIGTLAVELRDQGLRVTIVSGDKDLAQLVTDRVTLLDVARERELDADGVATVFGVRPEQLVDYLALVGDPIDNIPGVPGVGAKTARVLLQSFGSIEAILAEPSRIATLPIRGRQALEARLIAATDQLVLSRRLATIRCDVPVRVTPAEIVYQGARRRDVDEVFDALGFGPRIRGEISRWAPEPAPKGDSTCD